MLAIKMISKEGNIIMLKIMHARKDTEHQTYAIASPATTSRMICLRGRPLMRPRIETKY